MLATRPVVGWLCVIVLAALAARSLVRLIGDRTSAGRALFDPSSPGCSRTSRVGEASHAAMALGMAAMAAVPMSGTAMSEAAADVAPRAFEAYFAALAGFVAGTWLVRAVRRAVARHRGATVPCRPAHALEPHHVAVGLAMVVMAVRMGSGGATAGGMAPMPGMAGMQTGSGAGGGLSADLAVLALGYVWVAVVVLGIGLARSVRLPQAASEPGDLELPDLELPGLELPGLELRGLALLSAPVTVYACELTMTVVMGLMLLG